MTQVYSLSRNGHLCVWDCDTDLDGLEPMTAKVTEDTEVDSSSESEEDEAEKKKKEGWPPLYRA